MPFSRGPNNDLWNLLPTDSDVNKNKSDRLPTENKLKQSKERIQHWWREAWLSNNKKTPAPSNKNEVNDVSAGYTISTKYFTAPAEIEQTKHVKQ